MEACGLLGLISHQCKRRTELVIRWTQRLVVGVSLRIRIGMDLLDSIGYQTSIMSIPCFKGEFQTQIL